MFRLVKVLNGNTQSSVSRLKHSIAATITPGCALSCLSGVLSTCVNTAMPDYIALTSNADPSVDTVDAMFVTEDMIFKVEYIGTTPPYVGMSVGLSNDQYKADSVINNASGKGSILALDDDKKLVYVRFRK